ncbi:ERD2 [Enterospora canceri]|uniref:ER lumen protein-retaining receptor n=1 Tax=Enterospora canceri TaxID=1081671 RepID=A0A1Y1S6G0_9MICR|nr:ERD2 [Enterospora canceri]
MLTNLFRFLGDALMVISRVFLLHKVWNSRSVSGLSLKTQAVYLLVYLCRYVDIRRIKYVNRSLGRLAINYLQIYNTTFKIFLTAYQLYVCYLIGIRYRKSYYGRFDSFPITVLVGASCLIALIISSRLFFIEDFLYTLSLILEAVAILPQLVMTQESEDCESMTSKYIFFLGLYRLNYLIYFVIRKMAGETVDMLMIFTSLIQTALYVDFFKVYYNYCINKGNNFKSMIKN